MGIKFDRTISLGHVVSLVTMLFVVVSSYFSLEKRISINEMAVETLSERQRGDIADLKTSLREIKDILEELRDK